MEAREAARRRAGRAVPPADRAHRGQAGQREVRGQGARGGRPGRARQAGRRSRRSSKSSRERAWTLGRAEDHLLSLELFGMRFGLERMRRLLTVLGSPQERFRAVHVVGTNGKSTHGALHRRDARGARRQDRRLPLAAPDDVRRAHPRRRQRPRPARSSAPRSSAPPTAAAKVDRTSPDGERVTQFELLTAAAFDELARRGVEVAVVEAGLGGRYDATNVLGAEVVVLTNVGLEHTRWLGPTITDIAGEKLAVVRAGRHARPRRRAPRGARAGARRPARGSSGRRQLGIDAARLPAR